MDISKLIKNINNVSQYISATHDALGKYKTSKIVLNMSTILSLNQIRSLEIEYFNKCEETGLACAIFERLLSLAPSKTWSVLGKELVTLLQYWLECLQRHLSNKFRCWWKFLKLLLKFLRELRLKDPSLPNILVEHTTESLLDLATRDWIDDVQQQEILYCLNIFCSESSREIRFALRNRFGSFFIKLALRMSSCGYLPCQYSVLETLLRWLIPRQQPALRQEVAAKWFHNEFYSSTVADIFVERTWNNFFGDARDLLNTHNETGDRITSVQCKSLAVGKLAIFSGEQNRTEAWLDINVPTKCLTVLLDPRLLEFVGVTCHKTFEILIISDKNTKIAKLYRQEKEVTLCVSTHQTPQIHPAGINLGSGHDDVIFTVTSQCRLTALDDALRRVFCDKYQVLLNVDQEVVQSPPREPENTNLSPKQEEPRFSHPAEPQKLRSGHMVKQVSSSGLATPSSVSTGSLDQLREKLAALPHFDYKDKYQQGGNKVSIAPDLSSVTELSDKQSIASELSERLSTTTERFKVSQSIFGTSRPYRSGVFVRTKNYTRAKSPVRKSQSDSEATHKDHETSESKDRVRSPQSCLAVASGSHDQSIINDTLERIARPNDFDDNEDIVESITKEFMESIACKDGEIIDYGVEAKKTENCSDNTEAIENTPFAEELGKRKQRYKLKKASSTDESNTECIPETPAFVSKRTKSRSKENKIDPAPIFDEEAVESFFAQHFSDNKAGEVVISPTLAKKINDSSSESSDELDVNYMLMDDGPNMESLNAMDVDVLECLNSMVDKVCSDFDKCSEYLNTHDQSSVVNKNTEVQVKKKSVTPKKSIKSTKVKSTYKAKATRTTTSKNNKLDLHVTKMSTIFEGNTSVDKYNENTGQINDMQEQVETIDENYTIVKTPKSKEKSVNDTIAERGEDIKKVTECPAQTGDIIDKNKNDEETSTETPLIRRKRKLYSPKDDQIHRKHGLRVPETEEEDDIALSEFKLKYEPKTTATCYKEIEKERKKIIRAPRGRKSRMSIEPPSPKTQKNNDIFDKLKEHIDGEKVQIANNNSEADIYNFTSDSEDEDFKKKTIDLRRNNTVRSTESTVSKRGRKIKRIDYSRTNSSDENKTTKRKITKRKRTKPKVAAELISDLIDERIRDAAEVLDTSLIVEKKDNPKIKEPKFELKSPAAMEIIENKENETPDTNKKKNATKTAKTIKEDLRKTKKKNPNDEPFVNEERTESPLPGLVVETVPLRHNDAGISPDFLDKVMKICQNGVKEFNESNTTTQNLLSDVEKNNRSSHNFEETEDIIQHDDGKENKHDIKRKKLDKKRTSAKSKSSKSEDDSHKSGRNTSKKKTYRTAGTSSSIVDIDEINIFERVDTQNRRVTSKTTPKIKTTMESKYTKTSVSDINIIDISEVSQNTKTSNKVGQSVRSKNLSLTRNVKDCANISKDIEIISIFDAADVKSDKSITTVGITGHGESEERPPTPTLIEENIQPRNVGLDDLNESVRDYFDRLVKEINAPNTSHSNDGNKTDQRFNSSSDQSFKPKHMESSVERNSPVVSVCRMSIEDISKWLPSRRESTDSDISNIKSAKKDEVLKSDRLSGGREVNKSPEVKEARKTLRLTFEHQDRRVKKNRIDQDSDTEIRQLMKKPKNVTSESDQPKRLSLISPIKLFDELISECEKKSEKSLSDDEDFMREIKEMQSTKTVVKTLRNRNVSELKKNEQSLDPTSISSEISKVSIPKMGIQKRVAIEEKKQEVKKKRVERESKINLTGGSSHSSVVEWFHRNEPSTSTETLNLLAKDSVQNVLEKLDTTLAEIHQNTSRKFVHLFVEAQRHLSQLSEQRAVVRKETENMLSGFVEVLDQKIADWDSRSQQREEEFMKQLKERAYEIIRDDCNKKHVMVKLLREDVQAVLKHLDKH